MALGNRAEIQALIDERIGLARSRLARIVLPADVVCNDNDPATNITGLAFDVEAGVHYTFRFFIVYTAGSALHGAGWGINGPAKSFLAFRTECSLTSGTRFFVEFLDFYGASETASATSSTGSNIAVIEGIVVPTAAGTIQGIMWTNTPLPQEITAKKGSYVEYQATGL